MTAAELITLLRKHPETCGSLLLSFSYTGDGRDIVLIDKNAMILASSTDGFALSVAECWLTGAAVRRADEMGIEINQDGADGFVWVRFTPQDDTWHQLPKVTRDRKVYPTRLAATFAAIEAALDKETTT